MDTHWALVAQAKAGVALSESTLIMHTATQSTQGDASTDEQSWKSFQGNHGNALPNEESWRNHCPTMAVPSKQWPKHFSCEAVAEVEGQWAWYGWDAGLVQQAIAHGTAFGAFLASIKIAPPVVDSEHCLVFKAQAR